MHQNAYIGRALPGPNEQFTALPRPPNCIKGRCEEEEGEKGERRWREGEKGSRGRRQRKGRGREEICPPFYETWLRPCFSHMFYLCHQIHTWNSFSDEGAITMLVNSDISKWTATKYVTTVAETRPLLPGQLLSASLALSSSHRQTGNVMPRQHCCLLVTHICVDCEISKSFHFWATRRDRTDRRTTARSGAV